MKKVAFIIPMLQPYRISFYEKIVELNPNIHFIFFHGLTNHSARPSYEGEVKFETNSFTPRLKKIGPYGLYINDGLMSGIKEFNPDAIILFGNPGVITNQFIVRWAKRKKIKIALWVCSWDGGKAKGVFKYIKDCFTKLYFNKADFFLAYSSHASNFIKNFTGARSNVSIAYNGLDITESLNNYNKIVQEGLELRKLLPSNSFLYLYVGGLIPSKKTTLLINAFKKLQKNHPNSFLWIIGSGSEEEKIKKTIKVNSNIKFILLYCFTNTYIYQFMFVPFVLTQFILNRSSTSYSLVKADEIKDIKI